MIRRIIYAWQFMFTNIGKTLAFTMSLLSLKFYMSPRVRKFVIFHTMQSYTRKHVELLWQLSDSNGNYEIFYEIALNSSHFCKPLQQQLLFSIMILAIISSVACQNYSMFSTPWTQRNELLNLFYIESSTIYIFTS